MTYVAVQDVERDPHSYFQRVAAGETLVVTLDERPMAEITPVAHTPVVNKVGQPRQFGSCQGQISISPDFNDPLPEDILREFEGR